MSKAREHARAYAAWYAEKAALEAPYREWWRRVGRTLAFEEVAPAWEKTDAGQAHERNWAEWVGRAPKAPMYWVNPKDDENFIGVGDDGGLVFMPVRDGGGEGVDLPDVPRFREWLRDTFGDEGGT